MKSTVHPKQENYSLRRYILFILCVGIKFYNIVIKSGILFTAEIFLLEPGHAVDVISIGCRHVETKVFFFENLYNKLYCLYLHKIIYTLHKYKKKVC